MKNNAWYRVEHADTPGHTFCLFHVDGKLYASDTTDPTDVMLRSPDPALKVLGEMVEALGVKVADAKRQAAALAEEAKEAKERKKLAELKAKYGG